MPKKSKSNVSGKAIAKKRKQSRSNESAEDEEERQIEDTIRHQLHRENESEEEKKRRNADDAIAHASRRQSESPQKRSTRLSDVAEHASTSRSMETEEQRRERINKRAILDAKRAMRTRYNAVVETVDEKNKKYDENYLGLMQFKCSDCNALHFKDEKPSDGEYSSCCHKGKVVLDSLKPYPDILKQLLTNEHVHSANFKKNIRIYNSSLSFASFGAQTNLPPGRGPYVFRIHGQVYHRTSISATPQEGAQPKFAQLYILDAQKALEHRQGIIAEHGLIEALELELDELIRGLPNPFAEAFKMMAELEKEERLKALRDKRTIHPILMSIARNSDDDPRRYNIPTANEVAVIFECPDGEPPFERDIKIYYKDERKAQHISILNPNLDPMTYPLLFPYGEAGWSPNMTLNNDKCSRMSQLQYYAHRLAIRDYFNPLLNAGKLTQQFVVDGYTKIEANRLNYFKTHQSELRVEQYKGLLDHVESNATEAGVKAGIPFILPSSFIGSPRAMAQNYQDAMSIVGKFGRPDLFITMTCNPKWKEISENLEEWQNVEHRPDLVARVFSLKLKALMKDIMSGVMGVPVAKIHVIEFQKRGLPHAHILIILRDEDKPRSREIIDKLVWAEIPNAKDNPRLRKIVLQNMIHGPCGEINPRCPCMQNRKCTKDYPKELRWETNEDVNGYPKYRRREIFGTIESDRMIRNNAVDNSWIVPYNPYLLLKYNCHINTEICASIKGVKYLFKYIYKGHDCARIDLTETNESGEGEPQMIHDEIKSFVDSRYVSPPEAMWRIRENRLYEHSHVITRLAVHLPMEQPVYFYPGKEQQVLEKASRKNTTLTAWFELNKKEPLARQYLYTDIPQNYVYMPSSNIWKIRQKGGEKTISRMYSVSPRQTERYFLRLILLHVKGAQSFDDLLTVDGIVYETFQQAAIALNLLEDDSEWEHCLSEAAFFKMPRELRQLFAYICLHCNPQNHLALWEQFKGDMIEDFLRKMTQPQAIMHALAEIQEVLILGGASLTKYNLPIPSDDLISLSEGYDIAHENVEAEKLIPTLTEEQKHIFDEIVKAVNDNEYKDRLHFVDGIGGSGKTHLYNTLMHYLRSKNKRVCPVASTGIASNLLIGGRTYFSAFGLPVPLLETSVSQIRGTTAAGKLLKATDVIIFDEASMASNTALNKIDMCLRDIKGDDRPFGNTTVLIGGDFRQTLNIIKHAHRVAVVQSTIKFNPLWSQFIQHKLTTNQRAQQDPEFCEWLLQLGNGELPTNGTLDTVEIPGDIIEHGSLVTSIFGNSIKVEDVHNLSKRAILCPKNFDVERINMDVENILEGATTTYTSIDSVVSDDPQTQVNFPTEFLNSVTPPGMGPHLLKLKVGSVVILLRNLNTRRNLCNGTRLIVKALQPHIVKAEIISGCGAGQFVLLPRIDLQTLEADMPFILKRRQFPIKLAWAMTISKSQGQTLDMVGVYLPAPVFSHGQLYVACSRVRCKKDLKIKIIDTERQGKLDKNFDKYYTVNCVYKEVFD